MSFHLCLIPKAQTSYSRKTNLTWICPSLTQLRVHTRLCTQISLCIVPSVYTVSKSSSPIQTFLRCRRNMFRDKALHIWCRFSEQEPPRPLQRWGRWLFSCPRSQGGLRLGHPAAPLHNSTLCAFAALSWRLNSVLKQQYVMKRVSLLTSEYPGECATFSAVRAQAR